MLTRYSNMISWWLLHVNCFLPSDAVMYAKLYRHLLFQ